MKAAVLVLADTETHEDRGRIRNALETAKESRMLEFLCWTNTMVTLALENWYRSDIK